MEQEMQNIVSICIWISRKNQSSSTVSGILRDFKNSDTNVQFRRPGKPELEENEENDIYKALCTTNKKSLSRSFKTFKPSTFCKDQ